jgi:hypothetical protein
MSHRSMSQISRGLGGGAPPGHIPNPEVKPSSADGTAGATRWESRSPREPHCNEAVLFARTASLCFPPGQASSRSSGRAGRHVELGSAVRLTGQRLSSGFRLRSRVRVDSMPGQGWRACRVVSSKAAAGARVGTDPQVGYGAADPVCALTGARRRHRTDRRGRSHHQERA